MQLKNIESFWSTFFQKGRGVLGQSPESSSAELEILLPNRRSGKWQNRPVDGFAQETLSRGFLNGEESEPLEKVLHMQKGTAQRCPFSSIQLLDLNRFKTHTV